MVKIFRNHVPTPSSSPTSAEVESKKTSYWLEKLFHQKQGQIETQKRSASNPVVLNGHEEDAMEKKGLEEALKNQSRHKEVDERKVEAMVSKSNRILMSISSMFPWDLFVSTINVEDTRVTIIYRQWLSSQVHSIDIKDIHNIFIETSLFFASLTIVSKTFVDNEQSIGKLRKKEAIMVRRIIEGLRMFVKGDIDTTTYTEEELLAKLKELSTTKIVL